MSPENEIPTVPLAWHHACFRVPATWEVIRYRNDPRDAELVLSDRHGETMHYFARPMPDTRGPVSPPADSEGGERKPDASIVRRLEMLAAHDFKDRLKSDAVRKRCRRVGAWTVWLPREEDLPVFAGCYLEPGGALRHVAFPPRAGDAARAEALNVLASFCANDGAERRWALFGLDITLPDSYHLEDIRPWPASQTLRFENRKKESITLHRYGMLSRLLAREPMETFFARVKGRKVALHRAGNFRKGDRYDGVELHYVSRKSGILAGFMASLWEGRAWLWRCDERERLYAVDQQARADRLIPDLPSRVNEG